MSKVATILSPEKQNPKKHAFCFPICSECFNEVTFELSQIEKANQNKKLRKLESTYIEVFTNPFSKARKTGSSKSPGLPSVGRRALKQHFGSFHLARGENIIESLPSMTDNPMYMAAVANNLHHVPAIEELAIDLGKMKVSDSLMTGIVDKVTTDNQFIAKLLNLEFTEDLHMDLALQHLVKIYAVNSNVMIPMAYEDPMELDPLHLGQIKAINGTIIQKVLRFKEYVEDASINNILLLSLPITSPYRSLDRDKSSKAETGETFQFMDDNPGRESGLLRGIDEESVLRNPNKDSIASIRQENATIMSLNAAINTKIQDKARIKFTEEMYIGLEKLTFIKNQFCNYIRDHAIKNQIELIFSTETIPSILFDHLKRLGIVVIFPITQNEMKLLSMVLKAKVVNDIEIITRDLDQSYLGNIKNYNLVNLYDSDSNYQTSLIYMDKMESASLDTYNSLGVTIYSNNDQKNVELKKFLRENLVYLYFSLTEHEFVIQERDTISKQLYPSIEIDFDSVGDFRTHLKHSLPSLRDYMRETETESFLFEFTEVELETLDSENVYPDIDSDYGMMIEKLFHRLTTMDGLKNVHDIQSRIEQSIAYPAEYDNFNYLFNTDLDFFASLNITKNDNIMVIRSIPKYHNHKPYSDQDLTLSKYLKLRFRYFENFINQANNDWNNRQTLFYIGSACIKITVESAQKEKTRAVYAKEIHSLERNEQYEKGLMSMLLYYEVNAYLGGHLLARSFKSTVLSAGRTSMHKDKLAARKQKEKKMRQMIPSGSLNSPTDKNSKDESQSSVKDQINSYVMCDTCKKVLSSTMVMDSIHKNMSFVMFLFGVSTRKKLQNEIKSKTNLSFECDAPMHESDSNDDFCKHLHQVRVFQKGPSVIKFQRYELQPHKLMYFKHRENLMRTNPIISQLRKNYEFDKMQYEDKMAKEIGEYYIRQISFLTYLARDVIVKGNQILALDRQGRYRQHFYHQLKFIKQFSILCDIVNKFWFVMANFGVQESKYKYNQLLRSIMINIKMYDETLQAIHELLFNEQTHDRHSSYFPDIIARLCKLNREYTALLNPQNTVRRTTTDFAQVIPQPDPLLNNDMVLKRTTTTKIGLGNTNASTTNMSRQATFKRANTIQDDEEPLDSVGTMERTETESNKTSVKKLPSRLHLSSGS